MVRNRNRSIMAYLVTNEGEDKVYFEPHIEHGNPHYRKTNP